MVEPRLIGGSRNVYGQNQCLNWVFVTFCAQKVTKKAWLSKNLTILTPLRRRKKNSPQHSFGPLARLIREAQTVFCLTRLLGVKMEIFLRPFAHSLAFR